MFFYDWTYILVVIGLLLGLAAQGLVSSAFSKYSAVQAKSAMPAYQAAKVLLDSYCGGGISVERISGKLTDNYSPQSHILRLSDSVYASSSVAALGIAAHEAGHAQQQFDGYKLLSLRTALIPAVNFSSKLAIPIFILGMIFSLGILQSIGIILFSIVLLLSLITLPIEIDASRRAMTMLTSAGLISGDETNGVKRMLTAAAMTYVASVISSALQLLRLILISRRSRN